VDVGEIAQDLGVVDGRAALRDLDMTPAFEWRANSMKMLATPLRLYS
jgi:hypothetical protein